MEELDMPTPAVSYASEASLEATIAASQMRSKSNRKLRIAIVSENLMPKVDGVTRCLARLLAHLREQGHEAVVLGPQSGMTHYETHPLVGTAGIPLVVYPGLKLNFLRPRFLRVISEFNPDVIHVVEPIWLGAQVLLAMQMGWAGKEWAPEDRPGLGRGVGGAVVASYHTNLPTYATLFGFPWLEPPMWQFVRWLHGKCLLTACPSQSTADMLRSRGIENVRLWPRGVDLELFGPHRRSATRRASWGIQTRTLTTTSAGIDDKKRTRTAGGRGIVSLPTPPPSPDLLPTEETQRRNESVVILYVGRISYEKNLQLLVKAFHEMMSKDFPADELKPKLVFVGDGPARPALEAYSRRHALDAHFAGHLSGVDLAEAYASADVFAFPSYTETFGQVILEALASGLPVVGLDAEGTRDLVVDDRTGLLLRKPTPAAFPKLANAEWSVIFKGLTADASSSASSSSSSEGADVPSPMVEDTKTPEHVKALTSEYAHMLRTLVLDRKTQGSMRKRARVEGTTGRTWFDAMEAMVDCYREGIDVAERRSGERRTPAKRRRLSLERCPAAVAIRVTAGMILLYVAMSVGRMVVASLS